MEYNDIPLIEKVSFLRGHDLLVRFDNGEERIVDMSESFEVPAALKYAPPSVFKKFSFTKWYIAWGDEDYTVGHDSIYNMSVSPSQFFLPILDELTRRPLMPNPFANSVKFLKVVNLLASPAGTTINGMMKSLGISRRSVFRLLEALEELGFPLTNDQSMPKTEKTYRLMDTYVLKLPNIAIPNPCFSEDEKEILLSMLNFCIGIQQAKGSILLNGIRQKVEAMSG